MKKFIKTLLQYVAVIVVSLLVAAVLRLFVVDFYSIPSDSIEPAIMPGDFILVDKLSFGARMYDGTGAGIGHFGNGAEGFLPHQQPAVGGILLQIVGSHASSRQAAESHAHARWRWRRKYRMQRARRR